MKHFFTALACILSVGVSAAFAQITVQENQIDQIFVVGDSINMLMSTDTTVNIGNTGGPNTYDFSKLNFVSFKGGVEIGSAIPLTAPDFGRDTILTSPGNYQVEYFSGGEMISPGKINVPSDTSFKVDEKSPGEIIFKFPLAYGDSWTYSLTSYDTMYYNGMPGQGSSSIDIRTTTVDGYGTLILPGGTSLPCLRLLQESNAGPDASDLTIFYVTDKGTFLVVNSYFGQPHTGTISISSIQAVEGTLATAVTSRSHVPASFSMDQNYPNPFNPSSTISYQLPTSSSVTLKVYDILGREVATLVNGMEQVGTHIVPIDGSKFSSGVYFYTITAKGTHGVVFTSTRKFLLLK